MRLKACNNLRNPEIGYSMVEKSLGKISILQIQEGFIMNNEHENAQHLRETIKMMVDRMEDVDELMEVLDLLGYYGG